MRKVVMAAAAAALMTPALAAGQSGAIGDVVQTRLGAVRGETVTEVGVSAHIYRGIPYAAAPVGPLRWKPPQPAAKWSGVRDARQWGNRCPQGSSSMGQGVPISEDCLVLNVVTAAKNANEKRPVFVFYHGGGLTTGASNSTTYNHPKLPNQGVVVVTVNTRLGALGYLDHPALAAEGRGAGNFGTLDIRQSLEWIRDNIAAFGGDPTRVTIMGESGGGSKVISQMASPLSRGLFQRVIVESGSGLATSPQGTTRQVAEQRGVAFATALGVPAGASNAQAAAALRKATWQQIVEAQTKSRFAAAVVVDGDVIPATVRDLFAAGRQAKVPLIVGANQGEASLKTSVPGMANLHAASGAPTYVYSFSQLPAGWRKEPGCVAFHGLELTYVFGAIPIGVTSPTTQGLARGGGCTSRTPETDAQDLKVADEASKIWAQFAQTGDPSVPGLIAWPKYTGPGGSYLDLGTPLAVKKGVENSYRAPPAGASRVPGTPAP
jgi:para-nitrobenzyl esterase